MGRRRRSLLNRQPLPFVAEGSVASASTEGASPSADEGATHTAAGATDPAPAGADAPGATAEAETASSEVSPGSDAVEAAESDPASPSSEAAEAEAPPKKRKRRERPPMAFVGTRNMLQGWRPKRYRASKFTMRVTQAAEKAGLQPHEYQLAGAMLGLAVGMVLAGIGGLLAMRFALM